MLSIRCGNDSQTYKVNEGISLLELYNTINPKLKFKAVSAKVNNVGRGLNFRLYNNADVTFHDITDQSGLRTYTRTLLFILGKAVSKLYDGCHVSVEAPVSNGFFVYLRHSDDHSIDVDAIKAEMDDIIRRDIPFERVVCPTEEAIRLFEKQGMLSKAKLLRTTGTLYTTYYTLDGYPDYYYSDLCPSSGWIDLYGLEACRDGVLLRLPDPDAPGQLRPFVKQEKMLDVFKEHRIWQYIGGIRTIGDLNEILAQGYTNEVINVSEALQEKKICHIAEDIQSRKTVRLVLISGPSSSGKTTFSKRLSVQLIVCGIRPYAFSMDDYFVPRTQTPRDEEGNYDYESVDALNIPLLTDHLQRLFAGEEVELPRYDFKTGESLPSGRKLKLGPKDVLIMEGIHALNPKLTEQLADALKYKVYVSALTSIQLDNQNYISTRDNRLLRRIVRDYKYRGYSATDTIGRWGSVSKGENKWIFPFQEEADAMFNSALLFELALLRTQALPLLEMVPESAPEYAEAYRLRKFLNYINPMRIEALPPASLLREFLGGSSFAE